MKNKLKKQFQNKINFAKDFCFKSIILPAETNEPIPLDFIPDEKEIKKIANKNSIKTLLLIDFIDNNDTLYQLKESA